MKSSTAAMAKQISINEDKILRYRSSAEQIVRGLLDSGFTAKIVSVREMANGEEVYRVILRKRVER
jgi:hypothetical protein